VYRKGIRDAFAATCPHEQGRGATPVRSSPARRRRFSRAAGGIQFRLTMTDAGSTPDTAPPRRRRLLEASPRFADSFGLVLLLLVIGFFVLAAGDNGDAVKIASMVIFAATTWLALRASQVKRRILRLALAIIPLATALGVALVLVGSDDTATFFTKALTVLLVLVAPVAILRRLVDHPVISLNTFYGAVCVYLLIALLFATIYGLIALIADQQFFAQLPNVLPKDTPQLDYVYFSFTTITTTGYGDFTSAINVGRMTAVIEMILGQLYLITVVALVVQNLGQQSRLGRRMEQEMQEKSQGEGGEAAPGDDAEPGSGDGAEPGSRDGAEPGGAAVR
jgi:hypothetical protein